MSNLPTLISEARKEFDERFRCKCSGDTCTSLEEGYDHYTEAERFIFHDYTQKLLEGILEEIERHKLECDKCDRNTTGNDVVYSLKEIINDSVKEIK